MKLATLDDPVRLSWITDQGARLDPGPYVSAAYAARMHLRRVPCTVPLREVTERIFHPGRIRRQWTAHADFGVPFVGSADIFEADLSYLPLITRRAYESNSRLPLEPGWTLVTRSGMTAGRVTYARHSMRGYACSEDVLRVVPNLARIPSGYLYTYLASRYGIPIIKGGIYGTSVRHIEAEHIADLPVPRFDDSVEKDIDALIADAMVLRQYYEDEVKAATSALFASAGLPELASITRGSWPRAKPSEAWDVDATSLRALNYDSRVKVVADAIRSGPHRVLGEICKGGEFSRGSRFTRIPAQSNDGHWLVGQEQLFWMRPYGRMVALPASKADQLKVKDETVMVAAQGLLTDKSLIGRAGFLSEQWRSRFIFSEHLLRIRPGCDDFSAAYLYGFMRSEVSFRMMRSLCAGTGPQDINSILRQRVPVPECSPTDRERIAEIIRQAYRDRDEADRKEDQAFALLDDAMREAAR